MTTSSVTPTETADALAAVRRLAVDALAAEDELGVYSLLAQELFTVFGVDDVHVSRLGEDGRTGHAQQFIRGTGRHAELGTTYVQHLEETAAALVVARTGEPLAEPDAPGSQTMNQDLTQRYGAASALFVPVAFDGDVRAVMVLVSKTRRIFSAHEVQLVFTLVHQSAAALTVMQMRTEMASRADRQAALARAASALNAQLELRGVLQTLCREANLAVGGDTAGVYLGNADTGGLAVAGDGLEAENADWYGYVIRPGVGVGGRVLLSGAPVVSNDYHDQPLLPSTSITDPIEAAIGVPVRWDGQLKGALSVAFTSPRTMGDDDIELLQAMADLAAAACSNAEAFERAQLAARTDSLTGLLNHGAMHVRLRDEIERVVRTDEPLSCLLLDLDDFKAVNDTHGHGVGDEVLRRVAATVAEEFRPYDGIGRYGGDEFAVILPGTGTDDARRAAVRVQRAVTAALSTTETTAHTTTSVGIASWHAPQDAAELLDHADRALMLAKRRGKDQTVEASVEAEEELARLEFGAGDLPGLMGDLWDAVSRCERPREVLGLLPDLLRSALDIDDCVLVHPDLLGDPLAVMARLDGGPVTRPTLAELRAAVVGERPLPVRDLAGPHAALALQRDGRLYGLLVMRRADTPFTASCLRMAELAAGQAVTAVTGQTGGASRTAVGALAAAIDARDNYTHEHSEQVVALVEGVARRMELPSEAIERIRDGAMLHDVGKVAIPNEILFKPGPLDADEWKIMREHPVIGERILRRTPELSPIAPVVRHEHERWDGGGYPDGLSGPAIPVGSRVILACDAYNAMITTRPYREPMSHEQACAELREGAGSQFDPDVVAALLAVLSEQPALR